MLSVTAHLRDDRWLKRGDPASTPLTAWERGQPLDVSVAAAGLTRVPPHDEARYDPVTLTVIFRRDTALVTCYSVAPEAITNDAGTAVLEAVEAQYGPVEEHQEPTTDDRDPETAHP